MSFLINPFIYTSEFPNIYSMQMIRTTTAANIERLYINNRSNAIDTALRDTTPNVSFSLWFKQDTASSGTSRHLFTKYDDFAGRDRCFTSWIDTSNTLRFLASYDNNNLSLNLETQAIFTASTWQHIVFVYDNTKTTVGTIAKVYLNGVEYTNWLTQTVSTTNKRFSNTTIEANRGRATLGCVYAGATFANPASGFGGLMDDFTFWDKSLSQSEAEELYNSGKPKDVSTMASYSANCLAWYRMGDDPSDVWNGSIWTIKNVKGTASTDMISANLLEADRKTEVY